MGGCAYLDPANREMDRINLERQKQLQSINLTDGVSFEEADFLGGEYFSRYVSGCGVTGKPIDKGDYWQIEIFVGVAAVWSEEKIHIDKATGVISLKGYPTVKNAVEEWREKSHTLLESD